MLEKIKQSIWNIPGWSSKRKYIVLESDDWGAIRTRSKSDLEFLRKKNYEIDKCHYMKYDSLASEKDLNELFNVLTSFRDKKGNHPVITANCLVSNPDFKKIREHQYRDYYSEPIELTMQKYDNHGASLGLWKSGLETGVFKMQSHGREHLNISRWMSDLRNNNSETKLVFDLEMFGLSGHISKFNRGSYLAAFDGAEKETIYSKTTIIEEALSIFEINFGYKSESFIAPNYVWDDEVEAALHAKEVRFIQSSRAQLISKDFGSKRKIKRRFIGNKNRHGQTYLVRNCFFEPSENRNKDWVNQCLSQIQLAFKWGKPAIVSTHRVNYIGYIDMENRDKNLPLLEDLLTQILKIWPDVEFVSSDQLGKLIEQNEK